MSKQEIIERALAQLQTFQRPVVLHMQLEHLLAMIGLLQLALRHPLAAQNPSTTMVQGMIIDWIEALDPNHGDIYEFLHMGFDARHDA